MLQHRTGFVFHALPASLPQPSVWEASLGPEAPSLTNIGFETNQSLQLKGIIYGYISVSKFLRVLKTGAVARFRLHT